jgi:hypothetical protein
MKTNRGDGAGRVRRPIRLQIWIPSRNLDTVAATLDEHYSPATADRR